VLEVANVQTVNNYLAMKQSAGILLYRMTGSQMEVFLVHPGGPFFKNKDDGWWTIPKGEPLPDEPLLIAAKREFQEETGYLPGGDAVPLAPISQKGGKRVHCWAMMGDLDPEALRSNTFMLEWPPKSGKQIAFAEIDKGGWFDVAQAKKKINQMQFSFLEELVKVLSL
jgi:predicted NUDIX family NTP pyrophosphohydrolase